MKGSTFQLRRFKDSDADALVELLGEKKIYYNTCRIPYPYRQRDAEEWIRFAAQQEKGGSEHIYAIALNDGDRVVGCISVNKMDFDAELGYWLGKEFWGQGIATEAVHLICDYAFGPLGMKELWSTVFTDNKPSAKVLEKNGFELGETLKRYINKEGTERDVHVYRRKRG